MLILPSKAPAPFTHKLPFVVRSPPAVTLQLTTKELSNEELLPVEPSVNAVLQPKPSVIKVPVPIGLLLKVFNKPGYVVLMFFPCKVAIIFPPIF